MADDVKAEAGDFVPKPAGLQGAEAKAAAGDFVPKPPEQPPTGWMNNTFDVAAQIAARRRFNPAHFDSGTAGPPLPIIASSLARFSGRAELTVTPAKEIVDSFERMQERVAALEKAVAGIKAPAPGIGHNNPPEAIEELPISPKRWRKIGISIAIIKEQPVRPPRKPSKALAAARWLKTEAKKLASYCATQAKVFVGVTVASAATTAGPLYGKDIHDGTLVLLSIVSQKLLELWQAVEIWAANVVRSL